jgi:hypothetical protein
MCWPPISGKNTRLPMAAEREAAYSGYLLFDPPFHRQVE